MYELFSPKVSNVDEMIEMQKSTYINNYVNSVFGATKEEILSQDWEGRKEQRILQLSDQNFIWTGVKIDGKIAGYGSLGQIDKEVIILCNMIVDPEFQGREVGSKILKDLLGKAPLKPIELQTTLAGEFYKKFGFRYLPAGSDKMRLSVIRLANFQG